MGQDDETGRAVVQTRVAGPPGTYQIDAGFDGSDVYSASADSASLTVSGGRP